MNNFSSRTKRHINFIKTYFSNFEDYFEEINLCNELISILIETNFYFLSILSFLPKYILLFILESEKLIQIYTCRCKNLLKIWKWLLVHVSNWGDLHYFFYVLTWDHVKYVYFFEERADIWEPSGWCGSFFIVIVLKLKKLSVINVVFIDLSQNVRIFVKNYIFLDRYNWIFKFIVGKKNGCIPVFQLLFVYVFFYLDFFRWWLIFFVIRFNYF